MGWGSSVAKVISAVTRSTTPMGGGGGGISITGSQHVDNSVNTNVTAGDNSFNEDSSTNLGPGAVQSNTATNQSATGGGSLAKDSAERSSEGIQSAIAAAAGSSRDAFASQSRSPADADSASPASGTSKALLIGGSVLGGLVLVAVLIVAFKKGGK